MPLFRADDWSFSTQEAPVRVVEGHTVCDDVYVPLSEDEQRILSQIEQQLYETDPQLARDVASTTVYTHAARNLKWAVLGFVVGLVVMLSTLTVSFWLAFVGFAIMLAAALLFEQNARRLGRAGLQQLSQSMRGDGIRNALGGPTQKLRERRQNPDEDE